MGIEILGIGGIWWGAAAAVAVGTSVGTTAYSNAAAATISKKEIAAQKDMQNTILKQAKDKELALRQKQDETMIQSRQAARDKIQLKRRAQTETILTSPLGLDEEASTAKPTILGAG